MLPRLVPARCARVALVVTCLLAATAISCGVIPFSGHPASGYEYGSGAPLRVAVIDEASGDWSEAIGAALVRYGAASNHLAVQSDLAGANIVVTVRDYRDGAPPELHGYLFPLNAGGFAAVYDSAGNACNYPPSTLPLSCTGEIATADIYLNNIIPPGPDIEARRERLILHELGHALGLTRHSPDLDVDQLAQRYGWVN